MGIRRVVFLHSYADHKGLPEDEGVEFLKRFGVAVEQYKGELALMSPLI
jgi:dCMP deaminase